MIQKVTTAQHRANFLAAANAQLATRAQLGMRLALFGDLPGSGWQFYTSAPEEAPLAIALRGASATVVGAYDPEELGSFLPFLGIETLTTPSETPPIGYQYKQTLTVYTLAAGLQLPVPPFTGVMAGQEAALPLEKAPSLTKVIPLLFGDGNAPAGEMRFGTAATEGIGDAGDASADRAMQEQYYADNTMARNAGMAEFWLLYHQGKAVFTLAASAVVGQSAYLSAGETIEAYRGQGIGGHYIAKMANEYVAKGYEVCFVCEAVRCRFYERLGFAKAGVLYQYAHCPLHEATVE